jgi:hypothetical protein
MGGYHPWKDAASRSRDDHDRDSRSAAIIIAPVAVAHAVITIAGHEDVGVGKHGRDHRTRVGSELRMMGDDVSEPLFREQYPRIENRAREQGVHKAWTATARNRCSSRRSFLLRDSESYAETSDPVRLPALMTRTERGG